MTREVDAGLEVIEAELPAVVTTDLRLNEPRFIKLPDIMKAKSKPIDVIEFDSLGVDSGDHLTTTQYAPPPKREQGRDGRGRRRAGRRPEAEGPAVTHRIPPRPPAAHRAARPGEPRQNRGHPS